MATARQKNAAKRVVENGGNVSQAMIAAGYSPNTAKTPQKLTESKGWDELMAEFLSDAELQEKHRELLNATKVEHMTFPLGPKTDKERDVLEALPPEIKTIMEAQQELERTTLTDEEIGDLLKTVNCTVQRVVHGQTARHVYYWAMDAKARKDALDMAYKLKGKYATEKVDITTKGEKVNISDTQYEQLIRAAAARNGGSNSGGNAGSRSPAGPTGSGSGA